jgi:uncharacterized repeat protein (TIGR01451 family)
MGSLMRKRRSLLPGTQKHNKNIINQSRMKISRIFNKPYMIVGLIALFLVVLVITVGPLVAKGAYTYGNSGVGVGNVPSLVVGPIEQYMVGNQNILNEWVKNPGTGVVSFTVTKGMCRCQQAIGYPYRPGTGQCQVFWTPGQPDQACQTTSEVWTMGPGESRMMQAGVTQATGQVCGSFQLDFAINGVPAGASFANMVNDCPNPPPPPPPPAPACSSNAQCGASSLGAAYCSGGHVYKDRTTPTCNNPGTASASCSNVVTNELQQTCTNGCTGGVCNNPPVITCSTNSQCGAPTLGAAFCKDGNVYKTRTTPTCQNPGTASSVCASTTSDELQQTCQNGCTGGTCNTVNIACSTDSQCGTNVYVGGPFCQNNDVYKNFKTFTCQNPGTASSYCTNSTAPQLQNNCTANQTCNGGSCVNNTPNLTVSCSSSPNPINTTQSTTFTATPSGGTGNYTYQWSLGCSSSTSSTCSRTFTTAGIYAAQVTVTSGTQSQSATCSVTVDQTVNPVCNNNADCGTNAFIGSAFCQNGNVYKNYKTFTCNNPGTANATCSSSIDAQLQSTCGANQTCNSGACQNVTINCSTDSQCGTNTLVGSPYCQNGNVFQSYKTFTCQNPGTASSYCTNSTSPQQQSTCGANQTCSNGTCSNVNVACSTNSQCGTNGVVGGAYCQNGNVYQNYRTYTCNNAGTANSSCSDSTAPQLQTTCGSNQTCNNGSCSTVNNLTVTCNASPSQTQVNNTVTYTANPNGGSGTYSYQWSQDCVGYNSTCSNTYGYPGTKVAYLTVTSGGQTVSTSCQSNITQIINQCTDHSYQQCSNGSVHWFNSCGVDQGISQACTGNQTCQGNQCINQNICSYHSYQQCSGNSLYWFSSCGQQQDLIQVCQNGCSNNTCITVTNNQPLTVAKTVENLSTGVLNYTSSVAAKPGDILQFRIIVSNNNSNTQYANNVTVRDVFPNNLTYNNSLTLDGTPNAGNIISGLNVGSLSYGQSHTITYQAQVAQAGNFSIGALTTLTNSVTATADNGMSGNASASVQVTRSGVLGATTVSTGLTNNFWADSFFLPLLMGLIGIWLWRNGAFGLVRWFDSKKADHKGYVAKKNLETRISMIRQREIGA